MILNKFWRAFKAQLNKLANLLWAADPIAQMQYEYDLLVEQLKEGRNGLEHYRALVERVSRQVATDRAHLTNLEAKIKAYLQAGDRETAAKFALELTKAKKDLAENETQLGMHEEAYKNNLDRLKRTGERLHQIRDKIHKYNAELKMSRAEAELAQLSQVIPADASTNFGQIQQVVEDQISLNKARTRVATDMSGEGLAEARREQAAEQTMAEQALRDFERQAGLITPETARVPEAAKELGPGKETLKQS